MKLTWFGHSAFRLEVPGAVIMLDPFLENATFKVRFLVNNPLFRVDLCQVKRGLRFHLRSASVQVLGLVRGRLRVSHTNGDLTVNDGQFVLLPACLERVGITAERQSEFLHVQPG